MIAALLVDPALPAQLLARAGAPPFSLEMSGPAGISLALLLVLINGFFVAAEFALVKVRPTQVDAHLGTRSGRTARHMIDNLDAYLSATQLGITLASLGLGWIGEPAVSSLLERLFHFFPDLSPTLQHTLSFSIAFSLISIAHIVLGELTPKSIAIRRPEATSLWVSVPLFVFYKISFPAIWLLNSMANSVLRLIGIRPVTEDSFALEKEEIRRLLASGNDSRLSDHKRELLDNIFELSERVARQIMVPRPEVVFMDLQLSIEENLVAARESGHTRFPLCDGDLDHTLGIIHIKDLFHAEKQPESLDEIRRETFFVPETLSLERLLKRMLSSHLHMAAILDEYGSTSGIVTLENVMEEIVGEIQDEFDAERPEMTQISDNVWQVLGSTLLADLENELSIEVDERDEDTIAGIAFSELGRRATVGDQVEVGPLAIEVLEVDVNRILALKVTVSDEPL